MAFARGLIDADAEKVVRKLARRGHKAYLVGGCVRDLLLGRTPKDFDVATSATPNDIRLLFRNCRIIGRRFRLAHIFFGNKIIETSTFRANPRSGQAGEGELLIRRDNVFGTDVEDARRRDFTINGLFYDLKTEQVIDYVGGRSDLQTRLVRTIGDPDIRFQEDPVRMLRAVKFAARLDFKIEPETYSALLRHRHKVSKCSPPRVLEEVYRLLRGGAARRSMKLLRKTGLDLVLAPRLAAMLRDAEVAPEKSPPSSAPDEEEAAWYETWEVSREADPGHPTLDMAFATAEEIAGGRAQLWKVLDLLDEKALEGADLSNALLLSALLSPFLYQSIMKPGIRQADVDRMIRAFGLPLIEQLKIARRDAERVRQVLLAQRRLAPSKRRHSRPMNLVRRDYFDEALAIYDLTARAQGRGTGDVDRWHRIKSEGEAGGDESNGAPKKRRRRRRGGRRRRRGRRPRRKATETATPSSMRQNCRPAM